MSATASAAAATRARILLAARAQCEAVGLRRMTMEDIARRAGLGRATLYRHLPSKDALVAALVAEEAAAFFGALDAALADCASAEERIAEGFAFALRYVEGHPLVARLRASEPEALLGALVGDGRLIATATAGLRARIHGECDERSGRESAELLVRLVLSLALTPASELRVHTRAGAVAFARRHLIPAVRGAGRR